MVSDIGEILNNLAEIGFFYYVVPFLVIFAIIFAVLEKSKWLGENKAVKTIVSAGVGLLSIQFGLVQDFFNIIFPRMGIGLAVILVALIFIGFFVKSEDAEKFRVMGYVIGGVIIVWALMVWGGYGGYGAYGLREILEDFGAPLLAVIIFVVAFFAITSGDKEASG